MPTYVKYSKDIFMIMPLFKWSYPTDYRKKWFFPLLLIQLQTEDIFMIPLKYGQSNYIVIDSNT